MHPLEGSSDSNNHGYEEGHQNNVPVKKEAKVGAALKTAVDV